MVTVKFRDSGKYLYAFSEGHATGSREVCAAVSAVMSVCSAVAIETYEGEGTYWATMGRRDETKAVFNAVRHTIARIAFTYPEYVEIAEGGFDDFPQKDG